MKRLLHTRPLGILDIPVYEVDKLEDDADGNWAEGEALISARSDNKRLTELHELLHAIDEYYELGLSETAVRCLEMGLAQLYEAELFNENSG